jgi:hypothetical protein
LIDHFIARLSSVHKTGNATNLYHGCHREAEIRRNNLKVYLTKMKAMDPDFLLLGEAPGYKGCRLSGIPFTSERVMSEHPFFRDEPIQFINYREHLESEISATIVWNELSNLTIKPLIWNIFPFHPHLEDDTNTNRTPTMAELEEGKSYLEDILNMFNIKKIIALGRKPESQLQKLGWAFAYIRHPANGGKREFVTGLHTELRL